MNCFKVPLYNCNQYLHLPIHLWVTTKNKISVPVVVIVMVLLLLLLLEQLDMLWVRKRIDETISDQLSWPFIRNTGLGISCSSLFSSSTQFSQGGGGGGGSSIKIFYYIPEPEITLLLIHWVCMNLRLVQVVLSEEKEQNKRMRLKRGGVSYKFRGWKKLHFWGLLSFIQMMCI